MTDSKTGDWAGRCAPTLDEIEAIALAARDALPPAFRAPAEAVLLRVADFAPDDILQEMAIEDPFELSGLYEGVPLTEKSVMNPGGPDVIWLFRRAILDEWAERGDTAFDALVAHVFTHELAHHFGWSDDDIASIDRWWE